METCNSLLLKKCYNIIGTLDFKTSNSSSILASLVKNQMQVVLKLVVYSMRSAFKNTTVSIYSLSIAMILKPRLFNEPQKEEVQSFLGSIGLQLRADHNDAINSLIIGESNENLRISLPKRQLKQTWSLGTFTNHKWSQQQFIQPHKRKAGKENVRMMINFCNKLQTCYNNCHNKLK